MMASSLLEVDSLEALIIIDNELDPMSPVAPDTVNVTGLLPHIAMSTAPDVHGRGDAVKELRMDNFCCSAHGLSILIVRR
jgi:7,8-dihydropterin-6-yl-methyl-4-(beta-D-ribofuranosyl)aminobenzene 5'-phosphate synthase